MQVQHTTITPAGSENLLKSNLGKMEQFVGMYVTVKIIFLQSCWIHCG